MHSLYYENLSKIYGKFYTKTKRRKQTGKKDKFDSLEKLRDMYPEDDFDDFIGWYKENGFNHASKREDVDRFVDNVLSDKINIKNDFKVFSENNKLISAKNKIIKKPPKTNIQSTSALEKKRNLKKITC
jgi:hypothetical protein